MAVKTDNRLLIFRSGFSPSSLRWQFSAMATTGLYDTVGTEPAKANTETVFIIVTKRYCANQSAIYSGKNIYSDGGL